MDRVAAAFAKETRLAKERHHRHRHSPRITVINPCIPPSSSVRLQRRRVCLFLSLSLSLFHSLRFFSASPSVSQSVCLLACGGLSAGVSSVTDALFALHSLSSPAAKPHRCACLFVSVCLSLIPTRNEMKCAEHCVLGIALFGFIVLNR